MSDYVRARPRLAGTPERASLPFDKDRAKPVRALIKLRLGHSGIGSIFVPEQVFTQHAGHWRFHQISFFGPPRLGFNVEPGLHFAMLNIDLGEPRTTEPIRCVVTIRSNELARSYEDGAQLYWCTIEAPEEWLNHPSGQAQELSDGDFALQLFHITNPDAAEGIRKTGSIWSSAWNLQGTRRLTNVAYVYLTSLADIRNERDLKRIAMASDGVIYFQTTSARLREEALHLRVYRENTTGRTESLPISVRSAWVAPPHLLLHRTSDEAYYEVIGPEIYRIGFKPGSSLTVIGNDGVAEPDTLKGFSYIVVGDASRLDGLAAPYDEEDTQQIMHLEPLQDKDIFEFWLAHANSDQMTGRAFEHRELE